MFRKMVCLLISILLIFALSSGIYADPAETGTAASDSADMVSEVVSVSITGISKHGNVKLNITFDELKSHDIEVGDIITVFVGNDIYELPVGTSISDVDSGKMLCWLDSEQNEVELVINMGSFAEETGIGLKKTIEEDPGYEWETKINEIGLSLKEKKGFLDEYNIRHLERSNDRKDYPELTDEEFANFRAFCVADTKEPFFYRSSSPLNPEIGRNEYVMTAMENAGIKTVINLDNSVEAMEGFSSYPESYYSRCIVFNPELNYDFGSEEFSEKVRASLVFITENDGPYLIHCKEGKDRTGVVCALLELFAGDPVEEVERDYMETYRSFYHVQPEDEVYEIILNHNLWKILCGLLQIDSMDVPDLQEKTQEYFRSIGLTQEQLSLLRSRLQPAAAPNSP